jgi:LacI family transcriptional regulator
MAKDDEIPHRPTLRSLAQITGLGISTVSQALRDNPEIAEETKRRVKLAAQQAGYRPDRAGVRLRTGKTNVISLILSIDGPNMGLVEQLVFGISEVLAQSPYHLVVTPHGSDDAMEPVRYVVQNRLADGIIISRTEPDDPRVRYMIENHIPFATHGRTHSDIQHPFHDYDNEVFSRLAVEKLAAAGRKNIVHIKPPPGLSFREHAAAGFAEAIHRLGLTEYSADDLNIDVHLDDIRKFALAMKGMKNPPDGYVSHSELSTMAVVSGLEEIGQMAGNQFDIVTKQCSPFVSWFRPGLILIKEDHRHAGRELAKAVLGAIAGQDVKTLQTLVGPAPER